MKSSWGLKKLRVVLPVLAFTTLLLGGVTFLTVPPERTPNIPNPFGNNESAFQSQTHFLVFTGSDTAGEDAATATAYYNAIDPAPHQKQTFPQWLAANGFIGDPTQWNPTGPQIIACDLGKQNGCDIPSHDPITGKPNYGYGVINTDSHVIVLNAADLGFVRNQFIRCDPSCTAHNAKVYTYLENYPVNPFSGSGYTGATTSGFPFFNGYPSPAEAQAAIASALNRPAGKLGVNPVNGQKCVDDSMQGTVKVTTDTLFGCKISRIADVAFEWSPPPNNPTSSSRYGKLYAYIFQDGNPPTETIAQPFDVNTPNVATHMLEAVKGGLTQDINNNSYTGVRGDPFPPNLDFIGFKQHPGVCFICHGGKPANLKNGVYPNQGNVSGFRYLPLDIRNLLFTSDLGPDQPALPTSVAFTDRANQEAQIKEYNLAVLQTVPTGKESDGTGATRVAHLREVITGWYTDNTPFDRKTQNVDFIPVAWRESMGAPPGSENLYKDVLAPSCRSCHFNREISLDFGTPANFKQESDILQLALIAQCKNGNPDPPDPNAKYMPLAHLTYQRYWQANTSTGGSSQTLPFPASPNPPFGPLTISSTADQIANYFGFGTVAGYCATNP